MPYLLYGSNLLEDLIICAIQMCKFKNFTNLHNLTTQDMIRLIGEQFWSQHWFNWSLSTIL